MSLTPPFIALFIMIFLVIVIGAWIQTHQKCPYPQIPLSSGHVLFLSSGEPIRTAPQCHISADTVDDFCGHCGTALRHDDTDSGLPL